LDGRHVGTWGTAIHHRPSSMLKCFFPSTVGVRGGGRADLLLVHPPADVGEARSARVPVSRVQEGLLLRLRPLRPRIAPLVSRSVPSSYSSFSSFMDRRRSSGKVRPLR
jgi:hypothetical protein